MTNKKDSNNNRGLKYIEQDDNVIYVHFYIPAVSLPQEYNLSNTPDVKIRKKRKDKFVEQIVYGIGVGIGIGIVLAIIYFIFTYCIT